VLAELDGTGIEQSVLAESCGTTGGTDDELSPSEKGTGGGIGWGYLHTVLKLMRASSHPGKGTLADAEENWSEAQGSQGSWLMKIGQRLRGAWGAGRCRGRLVRGSGEPGELPGLSAPQV